MLSNGDQPTGPSVVSSDLGAVKRPDGSQQVTFKGKPLYSFVEDSKPDTVTGDGVMDTFAGQSFTWHVAATGPVSGNSSSTGGGYGY
jgi:predicted lipoprotein with Yx(FWY)xxD motif